MSADDQALSTGKTVLEYVESTRKLATIREEIARIATELEDAATALRERSHEQIIINHFLGLPTYEKLSELTRDLQKEAQRHERLLESIKAIGLEG
jgi:sirohydrochlorin ferrochelatase